MKNYYVYIIECSDKSFYVGVTNDILKRFSEHQNNNDYKSYTFNRKPLKLVFFTSFSNIEMAIEKEKQIKKWSRNKKIALINGNYENLPNLSKKKF
ncbi:GIY-YIG nuclease family protein [Chishuiella sp.]|uniref:GIY-YIG nuclease family protein n=1 Tax=Chishuiella sp. TaxID=1969467 RepID=UPI0028AB4063|nr:GIY-YIG nuclease family protein [Chishuiella sp.]